MPSATLLLRRDKARPDRDGVARAPVRLRLRHRGHPDASLALGLRVPVDVWDASRQRLRGRSRETTHINAALADAEAAAREAVLEFRQALRPPLPCDLREAVAERLGLAAPRREPEAPADMLADYARWVEGDRLRGAAAAWFRRRAGLGLFQAYLATRGRSALAWAELTPAMVRAYHAWLMTPAPAGNGNAPSSAAGRVKELRTLCRQAVADGLAERDPTAALRLAAPRETRRVLTPDEVARLEAAAAAGFGRASVQLAADLWLFSFHAAGMRFSDVAMLTLAAVREADADRLLVVYHQAKTEKPVAHLLPAAGAAIARRYVAERLNAPYLFPVLRPEIVPPPAPGARVAGGTAAADPIRLRLELGRANARVNKALKAAAGESGLAPFSFHAARHSFASSRAGAGADLRAVQAALGHSSLAQTARYIAALGADVIDLDTLDRPSV